MTKDLQKNLLCSASTSWSHPIQPPVIPRWLPSGCRQTAVQINDVDLFDAPSRRHLLEPQWSREHNFTSTRREDWERGEWIRVRDHAWLVRRFSFTGSWRGSPDRIWSLGAWCITSHQSHWTPGPHRSSDLEALGCFLFFKTIMRLSLGITGRRSTYSWLDYKTRSKGRHQSKPGLWDVHLSNQLLSIYLRLHNAAPLKTLSNHYNQSFAAPSRYPNRFCVALETMLELALGLGFRTMEH